MASDSVIDLARDTLSRNKQALVFVNAKRSAESVAEGIAKSIKEFSKELSELSEKITNILSKPTKQCLRLGDCVKKGIAFHHSGLERKQREIIEENFKKGVIKIICSTPTLAMGLDLPAWRVIIRDVKRFDMRGMEYIPVLEFFQICGRAGRPSYDTEGQAIVVANSESEKKNIIEKYIKGEPEDIYSKLAVEPVFRTYLLSLISSKIIQEKKEIIDFFSKTFWAKQYQDMDLLETIIDKMLNKLMKWNFLEFKEDKYRSTYLGKRISQLYLDPLTADNFVSAINKSRECSLNDFSFVQLVCNALEMRPLLKVKAKEYEEITGRYCLFESYLLVNSPSEFEPEYDDWLNAFKTSLMLNDWMDEKDEAFIMENYDVRPGELKNKLDISDWLLYCLIEIAHILQHNELIKFINKTRLRLKYGAKEELLPLLKLKGIGRVRARRLYAKKIKDLGDIRNVSLTELEIILGKALALDVKKQVGSESILNNTNLSFQVGGITKLHPKE